MAGTKPGRFALRKIIFVVSLGLLTCLGAVTTGCGFFPPITKCTTNCTSTTNFQYVANTANTTASPASIAGFSLTTVTTAATDTTPATSTLTLATTPKSAYALGFVPTAMAITPANKFMYVSSLTGGIYLYVLNSDGSITIQNNSQAVASGSIVSSMKVDSTGAWLIVANASLATTQATIVVYSIASTTGLLTVTGKPLVASTAGGANRMVISPSNTGVYVTLGTGGLDAMAFNATTGALSFSGHLGTLASTNADQGVAVDPGSSYVFVTETGTGGLRMLQIGSNPALTEVTGSPFATGVGPSSVLVDLTGKYVYVTNRTDNTVTGFVLASGTLTEISGSPFTTGTNPVDIAEDSSKSYVSVVCNGGGNDLEVYSFDATTGGALDAAKNATTGTDPTLPIAIAATH